MSHFLNFCALWISAYTGFNALGLHFIVIAGFIGMLGWMVVRVDACKSLIQQQGVLAFIFRLIPIQIFIYSILSGIIYFIAYFIASLI